MAVEVVGGASEKVDGAEQGNEGQQIVWQGELMGEKGAEGFWGDESSCGLLGTGEGEEVWWDFTR